MVKETENLTKKGEFGPHTLPISGQFPKETLGASWHWLVGINPLQVSAINRMRSPWNRRAGLLTCFIHPHKHTIELLKHGRKRVH